MKKYILKCFRGEEKLWKVFWIWFVLFPLISNIIFSLILILLFLDPFMQCIFNHHHLNYWDIVLHNRMFFLCNLTIILLSFIYTFWVWVSVWRCSQNTTRRIYCVLARFWCIAVIPLAILALVFDL